MNAPTSEDYVVRAAVVLRQEERGRIAAPPGTKGQANKKKQSAERALYNAIDLLEQKTGVKP